MAAVVVGPPVRRLETRPAPGASVFLAGSIEMGAAAPWQDAAIAGLSDAASILYNPRRADWDPAWAAGSPEFQQQVEWELDLIEQADLVLFYFDPQTLAPVSLLELGLMARGKAGRVHLCCPEGYWRKANVDILARRERVFAYESFEALIDGVREACLAFQA